jgi:mRNA-degrading endonuclease RelE of RelBE toxin-antitoxin system
MHNVSIVCPGEDITGASNIRSELIHLVDSPIENRIPALVAAKIRNDEFMRLRRTEIRILQIRSANPVALSA